jgi:hypothetical protein
VERTTERDESEAQKAALAEVPGVINVAVTDRAAGDVRRFFLRNVKLLTRFTAVPPLSSLLSPS